MDFDKKTIEELKVKHGNIYKATIKYTDETNNNYKIEAIYREPREIDVETFQKDMQKSVNMANRNLFVSLVIYPETSELVKTIGKHIQVYGKFSELIVPFFGQISEATTEKL